MLEDILKQWGGYEVSAMEVYTDMFRLGEGYIQKDGEPKGKFKANPVAYYTNDSKGKGRYRIMFEDTFEEVLKELQNAKDFAILNGISYFGRRNVQTHASKMYAMIFDIDGVTDSSLNAFFSGAMNAKVYPVPNYIALSGHGVHLYYIFEEPVDLYPYTKIQLKELKYALTERIWNQYTSTEKKPQYQGINQGFRVIGGKTKKGAPEKTVRAFRINTQPFSLSRLNDYVPEDRRIDEKKLWKESKINLQEAKEKYPDWYQRVVVQGNRERKYWDIGEKVNGDNPYALYDWWKRKILEGATYGHRYFSIMCLAIYGVKCRKSYEEVKREAIELIPFLNELNPEEPFTKKDCEDALECYDLRYCTFPIKDISKLSNIRIERNKRNYRKQSQHLERARAVQVIDYPNGEWRNKEGRPEKLKIVQEWQRSNPEGKKADCIRDTGLSKPTVLKWWEQAKIENLRLYANKEEMVKLTVEQMEQKAKEIMGYVEKKAAERGISEEAYEEFWTGKTKKERLQEQADKLIFAEGEVTIGLLDKLASAGIRSIQIVPDEECETAEFTQYLESLK